MSPRREIFGVIITTGYLSDITYPFQIVEIFRQRANTVVIRVLLVPRRTAQPPTTGHPPLANPTIYQ
jgi:hypothetical protein